MFYCILFYFERLTPVANIRQSVKLLISWSTPVKQPVNSSWREEPSTKSTKWPKHQTEAPYFIIFFAIATKHASSSLNLYIPTAILIMNELKQ